MKKNKAIDAKTHKFTAGEKLLLDANIWLYLQPPTGQPAPMWATPYTALLKDALAAKAQLMTDCVILSEYINRYIRIEHGGALKTKWPNFKDFRKSADFVPVGKAAVADVKYILKLASPQETLFPTLDIAGILAETESGTLDFNDGVIVENCRVKGWKLVSNDGDMTLGGIEVLTFNNKLLKACP